MTNPMPEDPFSIGSFILLASAIGWALFLLATQEPSESAKRQFLIERWKPEEEKDDVESS